MSPTMNNVIIIILKSSIEFAMRQAYTLSALSGRYLVVKPLGLSFILIEQYCGDVLYCKIFMYQAIYLHIRVSKLLKDTTSFTVYHRIYHQISTR